MVNEIGTHAAQAPAEDPAAQAAHRRGSTHGHPRRSRASGWWPRDRRGSGCKRWPPTSGSPIPTVLHHFGSREGLVEAVVARALDSLHARLLQVVRASPPGYRPARGHPRRLLRRAGRSGTRPRVPVARPLGVRADRWRSFACEPSPKPFTSFAASSAGAKNRCRRSRTRTSRCSCRRSRFSRCRSRDGPGSRGEGDEEPCGARRFRAWLARQIHDHLEKGQ